MRIVLLCALCGVLGCGRGSEPAQAASTTSGSTEPAASAGSAAGLGSAARADEEATVDKEDDLDIPAVRTGEDRYELHFGSGRAVLDLGRGTLVAPDPKSGAVALAALAKWLGTPVPRQTHARPLEPVELQVMNMGDNDNKVFVSRGAEYAEMFINTPEPDHVVFVKKDSSYAGALVDVFADGLRDGPAPPRTKATDPNLATEDPWLPTLKAIDTPHSQPMCFGDGWIALTADKTGETVWRRAWGAAGPKPLCKLPGNVDEWGTNARGTVAVVMVGASDPTSGVMSGSDPVSVWVIDGMGCRRLRTRFKGGMSTQPIVSPKGDAFVPDYGGDPKLHVVDLQTGAVTTTTVDPPKLDFVYDWDDAGITLFSPTAEVVSFGRMVAGHVTPLADAQTRSLDGAYTIDIHADSLVVTDRAHHAATFTPHVRSDDRALARMHEHPPRAVGPRKLALAGSPDIVLDLETMKTQPLTVPPKLGDTYALRCVSRDGNHALFTSGDEVFEGSR